MGVTGSCGPPALARTTLPCEDPVSGWACELSLGTAAVEPRVAAAALTLGPPLCFQCVDNIRCNGLMMNAFEENSKVTVPQMIK